MEAKIIYHDRYSEPLNQAEKMIADISKLQPSDEFNILLIFLIEYSQMWYKAKCTAKNYCVAQYADIANGYAEGVNRINLRLMELFNYKENEK